MGCGESDSAACRRPVWRPKGRIAREREFVPTRSARIASGAGAGMSPRREVASFVA